MNAEQWIEKLKVGDNVVVSNHGGMGPTMSLYQVERVTPTQIVTKFGRFRRRDGREISSDRWRHAFLKEATTERVEKIRAEHHRSRLLLDIENTKFRDLPTETLEAISAAIKRERGEQTQ